MTMPLLEGLHGPAKMSKSLDNYVGIAEAPDEMFGKLMSISDERMWRYYELVSFCSLEEIERLKASVDEGENPRDVKFLLAEEIVARFHDAASAERARDSFIARHRRGEVPEDVEERVVTTSDAELGIAHVLRDAELASSTSEAIRLIKQGAVRVDNKRVEDQKSLLEAGGPSLLIQVGKRRVARVRLVRDTAGR